MKKEKTKLNKVFIWGQLNHTGGFLVTVSSMTAWLYSKNPKIANEFVEITNRIYTKLEKVENERKTELKKEKEKREKELLEAVEEIKIPKPKKKKPWFKFW